MSLLLHILTLLFLLLKSEFVAGRPIQKTLSKNLKKTEKKFAKLSAEGLSEAIHLFSSKSNGNANNGNQMVSKNGAVDARKQQQQQQQPPPQPNKSAQQKQNKQLQKSSKSGQPSSSGKIRNDTGNGNTKAKSQNTARAQKVQSIKKAAQKQATSKKVVHQLPYLVDSQLQQQQDDFDSDMFDSRLEAMNLLRKIISPVKPKEFFK